MTIGIGPVVLIWLVGLVLWLVPWPPAAAKLSKVWEWVFLIAFSVWLGLFH